MSEYEKTADRFEREADEMAERSEKLGHDIEHTRDEWEARKADDRVPGAVGEAVGDASEQSEDPPPEVAEGPAGV